MSLSSLLKPRSVAVIGASGVRTSVGGRAFFALVDHHFSGQLYPVNPKYEEIAGFTCYPEISAIPGEVDVAMILLGPARTVEALEACANKGVQYALLLSAGYAEVGGEGVGLQARMVETARRSGIRLLGPNCGGIMNITDDIPLGFFPSMVLEDFPRGHLGIVAQSGGVGANVLNKAYDKGIGLSKMITTGNEADLNCSEFLQYLVEDPDTHAIALYLEGISNPQGLLKAADAALSKGKPIIMLKGGVSPEGQATATSHTASLATSFHVLEAACRQKGIALVDDLDDLMDIAGFMARPFRPSAQSAISVMTSGGMAVMTADQYEHHGVPFAQLKPDTIQKLAAVLPSFATPRNPLDITAQYLNQPDLFESCIRILAHAEEVGVVMPALAMVGDNAARFAADIVKVSEESGVPFAVHWSSASLVEAGPRVLRKAGIPVMPRLETAVRAVKFALEHTKRVEFARTHQPSAVPNGAACPQGANDFDVLEWLRSTGVSVTPARLATSPIEAVAGAESLGYPVVVKVVSPQIQHKTEVGGVQLGLRSADEVRTAWNRIHENLRTHAPKAEVAGLMVQPMVSTNAEVIVGLQRDPQLGWCVMVGLGGVFAEVLKDVSLRLAPVTVAEAESMIRELRGFKVLDGARGRTPADVAALASLVASVSTLPPLLGESATGLDLNPVLVMDAGQGVRCIDALLVR